MSFVKFNASFISVAKYLRATKSFIELSFMCSLYDHYKSVSCSYTILFASFTIFSALYF